MNQKTREAIELAASEKRLNSPSQLIYAVLSAYPSGLTRNDLMRVMKQENHDEFRILLSKLVKQRAVKPVGKTKGVRGFRWSANSDFDTQVFVQERHYEPSSEKVKLWLKRMRAHAAPTTTQRDEATPKVAAKAPSESPLQQVLAPLEARRAELLAEITKIDVAIDAICQVMRGV